MILTKFAQQINDVMTEAVKRFQIFLGHGFIYNLQICYGTVNSCLWRMSSGSYPSSLSLQPDKLAESFQYFLQGLGVGKFCLPKLGSSF